MKRILILALLLFSVALLMGDLFQEGVKQYEARDYEKALSSFLAIAEQGIVNADLYYNIGNCYFRIDKLGLAILYYKKGLRINPNHSELRFNLNFALAHTLERQSEDSDNPIFNLFIKFINNFSLNTWLMITLMLFILLTVSINITVLFFKRKEKVVLYSIIGLLVFLFLCSAGVSYLRQQQFNDSSEAVLISSSANGYSGPDVDFSLLFSISEGMVFRIINSEEKWSQIRLPNGVSGWIRNDSFRRVQE